jgi:hypothetical protein
MVNMPGHFVGWFAGVAGNVDVSLLAALVLPACLYPMILWAIPDPRAVFGPQGPRIVPASERPVAPIFVRRTRGSHAQCTVDPGKEPFSPQRRQLGNMRRRGAHRGSTAIDP